MKKFCKSIKNFVIFGLLLTIAFIFAANTDDAYAKFKYKSYYTNEVYTYRGVEPLYIVDNEVLDYIRPAIIDDSNGAAMCGAQNFFGECLGADVVYNKKKLTVTISYNNHELTLNLNTKTGILDGTEIELNNIPFRMKYWDNTNDCFVPSKFVCKCLEIPYVWDDVTRTITIKRPHTIYVNDVMNSYTGTFGNVTLNNEKIRLKKTPSYILKDNAMVNVKKIVGQIENAEYYYSTSSQTVIITCGDIELKFKIGDKNVYKNGIVECAPIAPVVIYDEQFGMQNVYMPGRYVFNALGFDYEWDDATGTSIITATDRVGVYERPSNLFAVYNSTGMNEELGVDEQELTVELPAGFEKPFIYDDYYNNYISLDFKGDYTEFFDNNGFSLFGNAIEQIQVYYDETIDVTTCKLVFFCNEDEIFPGYKATYTDNSMILEFNQPHLLYDKIIVLDAGHGDYDPGATAEGVNEKDLNFTVVYDYCKDLFDNSDIKVYYTRTTDVLISLNERADLPRRLQADMFISVHHNSATNTKANGTSVYYSPTNNNLASFNGYTGKQIGQMMLDTLVDKLGTNNFGLGNRELSVTQKNSVPAILIECAFMSNHSDLKMIQKPKNQKKIAQCIFEIVNRIYDNPLET